MREQALGTLILTPSHPQLITVSKWWLLQKQLLPPRVPPAPLLHQPRRPRQSTLSLLSFLSLYRLPSRQISLTYRQYRMPATRESPHISSGRVSTLWGMRLSI